MANQTPPCFIHPGRLAVGYVAADGDSRFVGTHGVVHELNELGFRDMGRRRDDKPRKITIAAIGCSYVFGYGLDIEKTWLSRFADLVDSVFGCSSHCLNLGVPGASNDYIVRQVTELVDAIQPHIVLIAFAQKERLEYWSSSSNAYSIRPGSPSKQNWSPARSELQLAAERMSGWAQDSRRLYQAVRSSSAFCKSADSVLLYTYASMAETPSIQQWIPGEEYLGQPFPKLDFAVDELHPGVRSNTHLALKTFARLSARLDSDDKAFARLRHALGLPPRSSRHDAGSDVHADGVLERWKTPF